MMCCMCCGVLRPVERSRDNPPTGVPTDRFRPERNGVRERCQPAAANPPRRGNDVELPRGRELQMINARTAHRCATDMDSYNRWGNDSDQNQPTDQDGDACAEGIGVIPGEPT